MDSFGVAQSFRTWYGALLMGIILCMSVYMIALAVVRFRFFSAIKVNAQKLLEEVLQALDSGEAVPTSGVPVRRRNIDPPLQVLAYTALANRTADPQDLQELMKVTIIRQRERLERGQSAFGTMAAIGPFLGLLATVLGIIHSFEALAKGGAAGPNVVASGVAEALWGTAPDGDGAHRPGAPGRDQVVPAQGRTRGQGVRSFPWRRMSAKKKTASTGSTSRPWWTSAWCWC
jgi:biopolymer transport protein ExbB/TolQ